MERGFLKRQGRGVYLPAQVGEDDYTKELRVFLLRKLGVLNACLAKMPD